jgi:hypothetical protein
LWNDETTSGGGVGIHPAPLPKRGTKRSAARMTEDRRGQSVSGTIGHVIQLHEWSPGGGVTSVLTMQRAGKINK